MKVLADANGVTREDYGIYMSDAAGGWWTLSSGAPVRDAKGDIIARPQLTDILAQATGAGESWRVDQAWTHGAIASGYCPEFFALSISAERRPARAVAVLRR